MWPLFLFMKETMETEFILVETVLMYRMRYVVEVPAGKSVYALDTVTMEEAREFSQECLGELISSHRVVNEQEILELCDLDNSYAARWTTEQKFDAFVTTHEE